MAAIHILAASSYAETASEPPVDLKPLLREVSQTRLRRNNRFTDLALLGALRCTLEQAPLPDQCALYLASGQGNVNDTVSLMHDIVRDGLEPMPLSFINVSSNIAGFTVAQALGLQGRNCALSRNGGAFDSALELALMDLQAGTVSMALVGVVEECGLPLTEHRRRLGLAEQAGLAEQSSWLLLSTQRQSDSLAELTAWRRFEGIDTLSIDRTASWFAGAGLSERHRARLALDAASLQRPGYSESIGAHHLIATLARASDKRLCYLNGDGTGRLSLFEFTPPA